MATGVAGSGARRGGVQRSPDSPTSSGALSRAWLAEEAADKRLNAELEAKPEKLVIQAEEVLKSKQEILSRAVSLQTKSREDDRERVSPCPEVSSPTHLHVKLANKKKSPSIPIVQYRLHSGSKGKGTASSSKIRNLEVQSIDDIAVLEDCTDFPLAKTVWKLEAKLEKGGLPDCPGDDSILSTGNETVADAQIRFLKAKLHAVQEELDSAVYECRKKDDENSNLKSWLKGIEEENTRLQQTISAHLSQVEKYKMLSQEANEKRVGLQQKVIALGKELETLKCVQKQAVSTQSATEVCLNRALEEAERYKAELNEMKQRNKDTANQELKMIEELKAENKKLHNQKEELMTGFKKQLKLIDLLKRQKMHIEASTMLSFTEEQFLKAIDWGNY